MISTHLCPVASFDLSTVYLLISSLFLCIIKLCQFWYFSSLCETKSIDRRNIIPSAGTLEIKLNIVSLLWRIFWVSLTRTVILFHDRPIRTFLTCSIWSPEDNNRAHVECFVPSVTKLLVYWTKPACIIFFKWSLCILSRRWLQWLMIWVIISHPASVHDSLPCLRLPGLTSLIWQE